MDMRAATMALHTEQISTAKPPSTVETLRRTARGWTKKLRKDIWMTTDERFYRKEKYSML